MLRRIKIIAPFIISNDARLVKRNVKSANMSRTAGSSTWSVDTLCRLDKISLACAQISSRISFFLLHVKITERSDEFLRMLEFAHSFTCYKLTRGHNWTTQRHTWKSRISLNCYGYSYTIDVNDGTCIYLSEENSKKMTRGKSRRTFLKFIIPFTSLLSWHRVNEIARDMILPCIRTSFSSRGSVLLVEPGLLPNQHVAVSTPVLGDPVAAHLESAVARFEKRLTRRTKEALARQTDVDVTLDAITADCSHARKLLLLQHSLETKSAEKRKRAPAFFFYTGRPATATAMAVTTAATTTTASGKITAGDIRVRDTVARMKARRRS